MAKIYPFPPGKNDFENLQFDVGCFLLGIWRIRQVVFIISSKLPCVLIPNNLALTKFPGF
ncbi:MAG: hypothetical protein BGO39_21555 [Chloroflexi bacterium 54-19]|nr:MAG: hypothetical protein BGO39_21555 [Chloroflexi bacterium 54-19]